MKNGMIVRFHAPQFNGTPPLVKVIGRGKIECVVEFEDGSRDFAPLEWLGSFDHSDEWKGA